MILSASNSLTKRFTFSAWYLLLILTVSLYIIRQTHDGPFGKDFTAFLTGAHILTNGQGANLYNIATQAEAQHNIAGTPAFHGGVLAYIYPPYMAALFVPLTLLSPANAFYVWVALQWVVLLGVAATVWSRLRDWFQSTPVALIIALFSFVPIFEGLLMGQMSALILALWWWAFVSWRQARWGQLGIAVALAAFKPQMALFLFVALLAQKRWRALVYAVATLALLWGASILLAGPQIIESYVNILQLSSSKTGTLGFYPEAMPNVRGLLTIAGVSPDASIQIALAAWALSLGVVGWLWWRGAWPLAVRFGITVVAAVLFSPHIYIYDVSLLMLAVVCAQVASSERGKSLDTAWLLLLLPFALLLVGMYAVVLGRLTYIGVILSAWFLGCMIVALLLNASKRRFQTQ